MTIAKLVNLVLVSMGWREARPERMQVLPSTEDPAPYEAEAEPNPEIVSKPLKASEIKDCTGRFNIAESSVGSFSTQAADDRMKRLVGSISISEAENVGNPASVVISPYIK